MTQRNNSKWMVLLVAVFGVAACGGDAGDTASEAIAQAAPVEEATQLPVEEMEEGEPEAAADMQELPEGVTMAMIEEGEALFGGAGICMSCHAPDGSGVPNLGADLTDDEWAHSDGSYEGISLTIKVGVTADASTTGIPMPARGGSSIDAEQIQAIAAYVWTLSK